jgi:hypothetical protein
MTEPNSHPKAKADRTKLIGEKEHRGISDTSLELDANVNTPVFPQNG